MWQLRFKFTQFIRSYRVSLCTRHAVDGEATRSSFQELTSGGGGGWRGERCIRKQIITRQCDNYDLVKLLQAIKRVCESFSARRRIILVSVAQMHLEGNLVELFWPLTQSPSGIQIDYSSRHHWKYVTWCRPNWGEGLMLGSADLSWGPCLPGPHS